MTGTNALQGPFCQSCSMPLTKPEDFGTAAEGYRQNDYCALCYQSGAFISPDMTMREMLDLSTSMAAPQMGQEQASALLEATIPHLKRWRSD